MRVFNRTRGRTLIERAVVARTAEERRRGLIGWASLAQGEGLLLPGTKTIHTFGMRFSIDVAFLDSDGRVIHLMERLKPSRVSPMVWRSAMVVEMPSGVLAKTGTALSDRIELTDSYEGPIPQVDRQDASRRPSEMAA
jgi:uncharacterized membrane protein (UPF0127 family)